MASVFKDEDKDVKGLQKDRLMKTFFLSVNVLLLMEVNLSRTEYNSKSPDKILNLYVEIKGCILLRD